MIEIQNCTSFIFEDNLLSFLELHMHCDYFKEDLIFVDDRLPMKTAKILYLENLYIYI